MERVKCAEVIGMGKKTQEKSVAFFERNSWYHRTKALQDNGIVKYGKKGGVSSQAEAEASIGNARKNLMRCCGNSSFPANPIKTFYLKIILSTGLRKCFQKESKRQQEWLGHTPYMT